MGVLHIHPILNDLHVGIFYTIFWFFVLYILLLYAMFLLNYYYLKTSVNNSVWMSILFNCFYLNMGCLFTPIFSTLISVIICDDHNLRVQSDFECWNYIHYIMLAVAIIIIILFLIIQILLEIIFYETVSSNSNYISRKFSVIFPIQLILKITLTIIILTRKTPSWEIIVIIILSYGFVLYEIIMREVIFYSHLANYVN